RVDEDERDIGALGRLEGPELGVVLDALALPALATKARRVDEHEGGVVAAEHGVDRVPGGAGYLGHDHAVAPDERVQERRLSHVRPSEDRNLDRFLADGPLAATREPGDDLVEEVTGAVPVQRRNGDRVAEAEAVELERLQVSSWIVELVGENE